MLGRRRRNRVVVPDEPSDGEGRYLRARYFMARYHNARYFG